MGDPNRRHASYRDLEALPEHLVGEIIDGELIASPRPASPHALAASAIGSELFDSFGRPRGGSGGPGGWWILYEPQLHLGEDVVVPDLAGWRRERMPRLPHVTSFDLAPDWLCEVLSPSTGTVDRGRKMRLYARAGVGHLWMVDPLLRTLEVYRLQEPRWLLLDTYDGAARVRAEPFEASEIDLGRWWMEPELGE